MEIAKSTHMLYHFVYIGKPIYKYIFKEIE